MSGLLQAGGGEDVDDLAFGRDGLGHELADGGVESARASCVAPRCLAQRGLDGLEEADVVADLDRFVAGGAEGEGAREFGHHLHEALLAVLLLEDVLLSGGKERQSFSAGVPSSTSPSRSRASCRRRCRASPASRRWPARCRCSDCPGRRSRCRWPAPVSVDRRGRGNPPPGRRACRGRRGSRGRWPA